MSVPPYAFGPEFVPLQAVVGDDALAAAFAAKSELGGSLALSLVRVGVLDEHAFLRSHLHSGVWREADATLVEACSDAMMRHVPPEIVSGFGMLPLQVDVTGSLVVGVAEPVQRPRLDEAEFFAGMTVVPRLVPWTAFRRAYQRLTGRTVGELPQFPLLDDPLTQDACLRHLTTVEELANAWVRAQRELPPTRAERVDVPPAVAASEPPIVRVVATPASNQPTPIEPVEAVSAAGRRDRAQPTAARTMEPRLSTPAAEFGEEPPSVRSARGGQGRATAASDGIYGPASTVVDRMGHPSAFVRSVVRNMLRAFQSAATTDELMLELAEGLGLIYPITVVLSVRAGQLHVWQASLYRGPREILARRFEYEAVEPWDRVISEGLAFRGRLAPRDPLREMLGRDLSRDTLLFPIAIRGRAVAVVALDAGYEGELTPAGGQYEAVEGGINDALVRILRTRRAVGDAI